MKKLYLLILVVAFSSLSLHAQGGFDYSKFNGLSLGFGGSVSSDTSGGFVDIGYTISSIERGEVEYSIRNYIEINGGVSDNDMAMFGFRGRILLAATMGINESFGVRTYAGGDIGFSFFGETGDSFFDAPYLLEPRGFIGVEFLLSKSPHVPCSMFTEFGGAGRITVGDGASAASSEFLKGGAFVTVGGRIYF